MASAMSAERILAFGDDQSAILAFRNEGKEHLCRLGPLQRGEEVCIGHACFSQKGVGEEKGPVDFAESDSGRRRPGPFYFPGAGQILDRSEDLEHAECNQAGE